ncbi:MAG: hypothetical protein A2637_03210, partial [Candidatus Muproteobacteria bacterium RIFCSPHIGHO2_01_FULL_65_16]
MGASDRGGRRAKHQGGGPDLDRRHICAEAARIMAEEGVGDFHAAKRKAAERLNLPAGKNLPANHEVESALQQYLRLFHAGRLARHGRHLREIAVKAMRFLERFDPRLVGVVLSGIITEASEVQLHVTADALEEVHFFLQEHHIPFDQTERRLRFGGERLEALPAYRFVADGAVV